eukprot:s6031_g6.t1
MFRASPTSLKARSPQDEEGIRFHPGGWGASSAKDFQAVCFFRFASAQRRLPDLHEGRRSPLGASTAVPVSMSQEERDLIRALSEFAPQSLNAFDDAFNLLDGGMGVAVSAAMARRAALYGRGEQTLGGESRHILLSKLSSREAGGRPGFMDQVVDKLVKPKAAVDPKPGLAGLKRRGSGASSSRRPSGEWRRIIQSSSEAVRLPGQSVHLVPKRWRRPTSLRKGGGASDSLLSQHQHSFEEEDSESDLPLSPVKSQKDLSMLSVSTGHGFPSCNRSFHPHGVFREASIADSVPEQKLPLLRCPPEFQEPHRMPNCAALTATPEFLYLRVCELSGQLPCSEARDCKGCVVPSWPTLKGLRRKFRLHPGTCKNLRMSLPSKCQSC